MIRLDNICKLPCLILFVALLSLSPISPPASAASSLTMSLSGTTMSPIQGLDIQSIEEPAIGACLFLKQHFVLVGTGFLGCTPNLLEGCSPTISLLTEDGDFVPITVTHVSQTRIEFALVDYSWKAGKYTIDVKNGSAEDSETFNVSIHKLREGCPEPGFLRDP